MSNKWYKTDENNTIWWKDDPDTIGEMIFSFDQETEYNLFLDYEKLTPQQKKILKKECPDLYNLVDGR